MKLIGDAHNVKIWFTITVETMVVVSGAPLHLPIQEIYVPNLENQSRGILDITYDYFILWYDLYDYPLKLHIQKKFKGKVIMDIEIFQKGRKMGKRRGCRYSR